MSSTHAGYGDPRGRFDCDQRPFWNKKETSEYCGSTVSGVTGRGARRVVDDLSRGISPNRIQTFSSL